MSLQRITVFAALSLVVVGLAAPTAFAQQDLRNPDTRDAAEASYTDLRNPDTREVAEQGSVPHGPTVVTIPQSVPSAESGLDWGDAGIGAGGMLGLILLGAAGTAAITHRRSAGGEAVTSG